MLNALHVPATSNKRKGLLFNLFSCIIWDSFFNLYIILLLLLMIKKIIPTLFFIVYVFITSTVFAQPIGEIINVNYKHRIAFTDLSNQTLQKNDIVEIYKNGQLFTYLRVLSTSPVISQLVPISGGDYETTINFTDINIGNNVIALKKIESKPVPKPQPTTKEFKPVINAPKVVAPEPRTVTYDPAQLYQDEIVTLKQNLKDLMLDKTDLRRTLDQTKESNEKYSYDITQFEKKLSTATQEILGLETENTKLQEDLKKIRELSTQKNELELKIVDVENQLSQSIRENKTLIAQKNALQSELNKKFDLDRELIKTQKELNNFKLTSRNFELENINLQNKLTALTQEMSKIESDKLSLQQEVQQLSQTSKDLKFKTDQVAQLNRQIEQLQNEKENQNNKIVKLEEVNKKLDSENSSTKKELQKVIQSSDVKRDLSRKLNQIERERNVLQKEKDQLEIELKTLGSSLKESQREITKLKRLLDDRNRSQKSVAKLSEKIIRLNKTIQDLEQTNKTIVANNNATSLKMNELEKINIEVSNELQQLKATKQTTTIQKYETKINDLEIIINKLKNKLKIMAELIEGNHSNEK